ncbi:hypothetical protein [Caldinitratiruptor microaerophilus]|uniref:TraC-like domain-containing protein n=1 Tax=Caldinitratiruptor microaerophilus TaxID=671077 RepID=A0AA35CJZ2_9FIRM|nr:hypothetical protein [Caldinitratiruptor microaerophilus]BDG59773.1 hypothetical protein caldi_08630 [Caldinitratiruptor microaerophilus]
MSPISDRSYLIPRQVTTRFEFFPGFGWPELFALAAAIALGAGLAALAGGLGLSRPVRAALFVLPPGAVWQLVRGGPNSLLAALQRLRLYRTHPQRYLYRLGGASPVAPIPATHPGVGPLTFLSAVVPFRRPRSQAQARSSLPPAVGAWFPVQDVDDAVLVRRDGALVAGLWVLPVNLSLCSSAEQGRIIAAVHEALNALQHPAQILSVARPVDLDAYVRGLEARLQEVDPARQRLLRPYIRYVSGLVASGEALERRYYVLLPQPPGPGAREELLRRAAELAERLRRADLEAHVLGGRELLDLLHTWSHPAQAAFERLPDGPPSLTTFLEVPER